jgi:hypothetical protein
VAREIFQCWKKIPCINYGHRRSGKGVPGTTRLRSFQQDTSELMQEINYKVEQIGVSYLSTKQKLYCLRAKFLERYEVMIGGIRLMRGSEDLLADLVPALNFKEGAVDGVNSRGC